MDDSRRSLRDALERLRWHAIQLESQRMAAKQLGFLDLEKQLSDELRVITEKLNRPASLEALNPQGGPRGSN